MKQYEAVIKVMAENDGFATFQYLNQKAPKVPGSEWKTKTPFASIRRIVQDSRFFFKIKPGLWALNTHKDKLPKSVYDLIKESKQPLEKETKYTHYYYQGMIAEIGELNNYQVYVPAQDRNKPYLGKTLKDVAALEELPLFTYERIVKTIKSIDVIWMNERGFPEAVYEVEHSTDFKNSLSKFHELLDFHTRMIMVSDELRRNQFKSVMELTVFKNLRGRVEFRDYETLADYHSNPFSKKSFA
jgi:hypothetical protein